MSKRTSNWCKKDKRHGIYHRDSYICVYCSCPVSHTAGSGAANLATLDHIRAHHNGGTNDATNLVTCCLTCNSQKSDARFPTFAKRLSARLNTEQSAKALYMAARKHSRRSLKSHRDWAKGQIAAGNI